MPPVGRPPVDSFAKPSYLAIGFVSRRGCVVVGLRGEVAHLAIGFVSRRALSWSGQWWICLFYHWLEWH